MEPRKIKKGNNNNNNNDHSNNNSIHNLNKNPISNNNHQLVFPILTIIRILSLPLIMTTAIITL